MGTEYFIKIANFEPIRDQLSDVNPGFYRLVDAHGRLGEDWSVQRHLNGAESRSVGLIVPPGFSIPTEEEYQFLLGWFRTNLSYLSEDDINAFMKIAPGVLSRIKNDLKKKIAEIREEMKQCKKELRYISKVTRELLDFQIPDHEYFNVELCEPMFDKFTKALGIYYSGNSLVATSYRNYKDVTIYKFWCGDTADDVKNALLLECDQQLDHVRYKMNKLTERVENLVSIA
jgi:hypothetical protein